MLAHARHDTAPSPALSAVPKSAPERARSVPAADVASIGLSQPSDWVEMLELVDRCFPYATEDMMGWWLCYQRPLLHVARLDGRVAGFVHVQARPESDTLWINILAVTEEFRHRGIARQLLAHCERLAAEWGLGRLGLQCHEANASALRLYALQGHAQVGEDFHADAGGRYIVHDKALPTSAIAAAVRTPAADPRWRCIAHRLIYRAWTRRRARTTR